MKKVFITLFCLSMTTLAANAQNVKPSAPAPSAPPPPVAAKVDENAGKFEFEETVHDFGEVPEGPLAETDFIFKNVGKSPITIQEAHGSCGCTVPKWPQTPILPGKKGVIHVAYTSKGRVGPINKTVTINSNAQQSPMVLQIRGNVKAAAAPAATESAPKKN